MSAVVDLFAGIGWAEALRALGLEEVGIEVDVAMCATRLASGHRTIHADVTTLDPFDFAGSEGVIGSPPCPDWSTAGSMKRTEGDTGWLVSVPLEWAVAIEPRWVVLEQVPQALVVWEEHAEVLERYGYHVWTGILDAARYGVPQNRLRAILIASIDGPVFPPPPTHDEAITGDLFGANIPAVTLADVLGLEPGWSYDSGQNSRSAGGGTERYVRSCDRPCGTVTTKTTTQWVLNGPNGERRKLTSADAARLQTFRPDIPWQGNTEQVNRQIGNAVPPLMAQHILAAATGLDVLSEAA